MAADPVIDSILQKHTATWMQTPGVIGAGQGVVNGAPCILVFVVERSETIARQIPDSVEGYPVVIEQVGQVRAMDQGQPE